MWYFLLIRSILIIHVSLILRALAGTHYVIDTESGITCGEGSGETCTIVCNGEQLGNSQMFDCNLAEICIFQCDAHLCADSATIDATNSKQLYIIQGSQASQCLANMAIFTPNYGYAKFTVDPNTVIPYTATRVYAGVMSHNVINGDTTIVDDLPDLVNLQIYAQNASYLELNMGTTRNLALENGIIHCPEYPPNEPYTGPNISSCIIHAPEGKLKNTQIYATDGIPKGVWVEPGFNDRGGNVMHCDRVNTLNGAEAGTDASPWDMNGPCWWTRDPTPDPTPNPTPIPTISPVHYPTNGPISYQTTYPTRTPTEDPTSGPAPIPTVYPTKYPTAGPVFNPTPYPTLIPSISPTNYPTNGPIFNPTSYPTLIPTISPTKHPSDVTVDLTSRPSSNPAQIPSIAPTKHPSDTPTTYPTRLPIPSPTKEPSVDPTRGPTISPTSGVVVTSNPTLNDATSHPTGNPSYVPSSNPLHSVVTTHPTMKPSNNMSTTIHPSNVIHEGEVKFTSTETESTETIDSNSDDDDLVVYDLLSATNFRIVIIVILSVIIYALSCLMFCRYRSRKRNSTQSPSTQRQMNPDVPRLSNYKSSRSLSRSIKKIVGKFDGFLPNSQKTKSLSPDFGNNLIKNDLAGIEIVYREDNLKKRSTNLGLEGMEGERGSAANGTMTYYENEDVNHIEDGYIATVDTSVQKEPDAVLPHSYVTTQGHGDNDRKDGVEEMDDDEDSYTDDSYDSEDLYIANKCDNIDPTPKGDNIFSE